jgi:predicted porin
MMLKKLIPAAVLLAFGATAHAELTIYGLLDVSYGKNDIGVSPSAKATFHSGGDDSSSQGNSTSKVGLKGSTDLGSGIKANFKLETNGITSDGKVGSTDNAPFFNRQAWVGASGAFGEVRIGKQDSVSFQTMIGFDANGAANAASAQYAAGVPLGAGRESRSLQYIAPTVAGFKAQLGFVPEDASKSVTNSKAKYSAGLTYTAGPVAVALAHETKSTTTGNSLTSVAGTYDFGVVKAMVGHADGGTNAKGTTVGLVAPVAGVNVGFNFSKNSDTKAKATEVFVNKEIFKNTYAYADFGKLKPSTGSSSNAYALGVIYTF